MHKTMRMTALLMALLMLGACGARGAGATAGGGQSVELLMTSVGKGDAILLKVDDWCGLIDAGRVKAMGHVKSALRYMGVDALDAVFLTHTDSDHAGGLGWLAESDIPVGAWYASAMYTGVKAKKHPAALAAAARGQEVRWLERGDVVALGDTGATLRVLAPQSLSEDEENDNSLVMMLETAQGRALLTGDMELPEEAELLRLGDDLRCAVLKVPNHADDDVLSQAFANACKPQAALISTDSQEKPGTPDPGVLARLKAAGATCYVTQDAGLGIHARLSGGSAEVTLVDIEAPAAEGPAIADLEVGDDAVILENRGPDCDMTGWYLYSDRGNEYYVFPDGLTFAAGARLRVGTRSSSGDCDLLWDDKKVIHKSKPDTIVLYDSWGRYIDEMSNGM